VKKEHLTHFPIPLYLGKKDEKKLNESYKMFLVLTLEIIKLLVIEKPCDFPREINKYFVYTYN